MLASVTVLSTWMPRGPFKYLPALPTWMSCRRSATSDKAWAEEGHLQPVEVVVGAGSDTNGLMLGSRCLTHPFALVATEPRDPIGPQLDEHLPGLEAAGGRGPGGCRSQ